MKICFPIRKQNGSEYSSLEEVMGLIGREPHGSWLAGTNQLWHGGIHVSQVSAPGSVLTTETIDTAVPLQCMAKGEVVAWRLNQDYKTADYNGKALRYTSTFVLVKSTCKPDPEKENSWLEFYSLYMGLSPLSAFPKSKCYKAKTVVLKRTASKFENSASSDGVATAPAKSGELKKDARVIVHKQKEFRNGGAVQPFGLAKMLNASGEAFGNAFWVTLLPEFMEPDGEQYAQMPVWMQKAVNQGMFDSVTKSAVTLEIEAGDAIGFLGEDIAPTGRSNTNSCHYAHIEVISTDSRMPAFLNNSAGITSGQKFVRLHVDADLYAKSGEGELSVFTKTTSKTEKDSGKILCVTDCSPFEDAQHKTWYKVSDNSWMSQDDVDQLNQYDLKELGFTTLEEEASQDVSKSLRENWVKGAYDWLSEQVGKERGIQQKQVSAFYKNLVKKIDADGDGELSGKELYNALHHPELGLRDIAARLIVKHDSEWFGGSRHHRWSVFFQNYDRLRMAYAKQWLDDCEWMSQVDVFKSGKPVWHFHPVMFLSALKTEEDCAKLMWGEIVNQRLGTDKACEFRKKIVKICAELWGEEKKTEYANSLMACMAVETSRLFTSSVVKLMPKVNSKGEVLLNSKGKPIKEYRPITKQELTADPSIASQNAVGLIQFTGPAVTQLNRTHGLSVTKQDLALMDEIEQLDYVKLYFSSNKTLFNKIKSSDDIYLYIFCPAGIGKNDDFALYSRQKDKDEGVNYYHANSSLDSNEHGNNGNNDGVIQRGELLTRLNKLRDEGGKYINKCICNPDSVDISKEPSGAQWVNRFQTSASLGDLLPTFSSSVQNFIQSIENAGGNVRISATYRPVERAYLMHYSWRIAREGMDPVEVPAKEGVNIDWTHKGNHAGAVAAAQDMVSGYHIVYKPALTSRHTQKRAIDMTITNIIGKLLKDASGTEVLVQSQSSLHSVGVTYGIYKLLSDPPHWSDDGH